MRAKEDAKHAKPQDKIQDAIPRQGSNAAAHVDGANDEHPVIPPANPPAKQSEEMEEIPIAGRTKMTIPKNKDAQDSSWSDLKPEEQEETTDHLEAKSELNSILKQSPGMLVFVFSPANYEPWKLTAVRTLVIIFSKSYCPYSMKAKSILLDHYLISPKPFVVELDQHPIGAALQSLLAQKTGRRTVPNVLVNGKSIGGGDDIASLDHSDELASKLRELGGKWVADVIRAPPMEAHL
ncbi:coiled-coil domain-containing protein 25 [Penicillium atrosanguineum]|uniref:Glutaredoxin domain-containing protein n=1 Tax=Penicillium atrosanguineum TaxID=1132637 RepID=A0A9W9PQN0_9EURO|nr:coiled-coil domain-containing protein 25 [Penicillium atrosanguineum]KAJ5289412.1 coiled-coil domain-containing protein 25 [Penicillium atrosanguineum]KAJ5307227.1 hypothetical protein N7476_007883 [Penicillium atrosanguineum]